MIYSEQQQLALEKIGDFLKDTEHQIFILKGYAGTGKTTLVKALTKKLSNEQRTFYLATPTGRAAKVLADKTLLEANTIHRHLYQLKDTHLEKDNLRYVFDLSNKLIEPDSVLIIDEASLVSDKKNQEDNGLQFGSGRLLSDILTHFNPTVKNNVKILFIGDNAQLAPVGDNKSHALTPEWFHDKGYKLMEAELTEVFRTSAESPVLHASMQIRDAIRKGVYNRIKFHFVEKLQRIDLADVLKKYASISDPSKIIICGTNRLALMYSQQIRKNIYHRTKVLEVGDLVMMAKNHYYDEGVAFNGSFAEVIAIGENLENKTVTLKKKDGETQKIVLKYRNVVLLTDDHKELTGKVLMNFLVDRSGSHIPSYGLAMFLEVLLRAKQKGIQYKKGGDSLANEMFTQFLKTDPWYNCFILKYAYAITAHKAQGGEWNHVLVDMATWLNTSSEDYFRWVYTAITRTNNYLYLINPPQTSPFSKINVKESVLPKISPKAFYVQQGVELNDEQASEKFPFVRWRNEKLMQLTKKKGWDISIKSMQHQQEYTFTIGDEKIIVRQYYNAKYFNPEWKFIRTNTLYEKDCSEILNNSMFTAEVPPPQCMDVRGEFYDLIKEICAELDIKISNVVEEQWRLLIYLITDHPGTECSVYINAKMMLTHLNLSALKPETDAKYQTFLYKIKNFIAINQNPDLNQG